MSILPDVLEPGLKVVFVGTAASRRCAEVGAPYAGPGNRFWDILDEIGLTPQRLDPLKFRTMTQYGIGMTVMAPHRIGNDDVLRPEDFDPAGVRAKIEHYKPRVLAFVGKRAAQEFFGRADLAYGLQAEKVGSTAVFVLPSTSGAARRYWDTSPWYALATYLKSCPADTHGEHNQMWPDVGAYGHTPLQKIMPILTVSSISSTENPPATPR